MTATKKKASAKTESATTAGKTSAPKAASGANANEKKSSSGLVAGVIGGVVLIAAVVLFMNMGSLAKGMIEKVATDTLGVKVTLASLDIKPVEKTVTVTGLNIANPQGFKTSSALKIQKIDIAAESLSPELLVFKQISVEGTGINFEITESATNLSAISKNVDREAASKNTDAQQKQPPKVIVRELLFNGIKLTPSTTLTGGELAPVEIANLSISGIGERQNGVLASEAIAQVLDAVTKTSMQVGMQAGFLQGMSPQALGDIKSQFGMTDGFKEQARQGIENLKSGLKNLFGGSEETPAPAPAQQ